MLEDRYALTLVVFLQVGAWPKEICYGERKKTHMENLGFFIPKQRELNEEGVFETNWERVEVSPSCIMHT